MPATRTPKLTNSLVKNREACKALGCSPATFRRKWRDVFTDTRSPADRRERCERKVLADELDVAIEQGAAAVLTFRRLLKRL